jgi:2-iminobutanoate/2-iminopropanoate deaminase
MDKQSITTPDAPNAIGPYSQAIRHGGLLWCSGQLGLKPSTGVLVEGVEEQAEQALINLSAICREADTSLERALRCTVYLVDLGDFAAVNAVYERFFGLPYPARVCVQVAALPKGGLVEIEAIVAMP